MEHEDNTQFENYLQNPQNNIIMENLQMASGGDGGDNIGGGNSEEIVALGGIGIGIGANIGGKFEEHDERDDDEEWKYIKEVQQSEKQQTLEEVVAAVDDDHEHFDGDGVGRVGVGIGNGSANHEHGELMGIGNGDVAAALASDDVAAAARIAGAFEPDEEEEEVEIIKNDADFSTTSNSTSTAGDDEVEAVDVLQVEMKIEVEQHQLLENMPHQREEEEEDPSSLATNTTNGTSSLSDNPPQQQLQHEEVFGATPTTNTSAEEKDSVDATMGAIIDGATRPDAFEFELHSQLNPDAKEFVPSLGSNPPSPTLLVAATAPFADGVQGVGEPAVNRPCEPLGLEVDTEQQPPQSANVARHWLGDDDDFIAHSPRKGRGADMDAISLPPEFEFEHECAKRPHELEQEDDIIGDATSQSALLEQQTFENGHNDGLNEALSITNDCSDNQQRQSLPANVLLDHGPETCVDLDADIDEQPVNDNTRQSMHKSEQILDDIDVDVFNTVQPLPDFDSVNSSFVDEPLLQQRSAIILDALADVGVDVNIDTDTTADIAGDKELLNVEEKEHVSHSPSTEEMQLNFQNELHASAKDIPQIPIDMDNAAHMQESFYMEHTSSDAPALQQLAAADHSLLIDTSMPLENSQFDILLTQEEDGRSSEHSAAGTPTPGFPLESARFLGEQLSAAGDDNATPLSSLEKPLMEETKQQLATEIDELEQKMAGLNVAPSGNYDGNLSQIEEVAQVATTIGYNNAHPLFGEKPAHKYEQTMADDFMDVDQTPEKLYAQHTEFMDWPASRQVGFTDQLHQLEEIAPQQHPSSLIENEFASVVSREAAPEAAVASDAAVFVEKIGSFEMKVSQEPVVEVAPIVEEPVPAPAELMADTSVVAPAEIGVEAAEEPSVDTVAAAAAVAASVAAVAAIAVTAAATKKPTSTASSKAVSSTTGRAGLAAKPRVSMDAKKAPTDSKKPATAPKGATTGASAARPRTTLARPSGGSAAEKRTTATTLAAARPAVGAAKKPLAATGTMAARPASKTTSAPTAPRTTTATLAKTSTTSKTAAAAPRSTLISSAAARKPTTAAAGLHATTNGTTAKPRPASASAASAHTKPTTLFLPAAAKPKATSPRETLTSQLRKPGPTAAAVAGAKSPTKPASATNGSTATRTTATMRSKALAGTTTSTTTTTVTKTFTARPAPRTSTSAASTTASATRRLNVGTTTTTARTNSSSLKKTPSPIAKPPTSAGKISPVKGAGGAVLMNKTKEAISKAKTHATTADDSNGDGSGNGVGSDKELRVNGGDNSAPHADQLNGGGDMPHLEQHPQQPAMAAELVLFDD